MSQVADLYILTFCSNRDGSEVSSPIVTLGATRNVIVDTVVFNTGDDAFQATITISAPTALLEIRRLSAGLNGVC